MQGRVSGDRFTLLMSAMLGVFLVSCTPGTNENSATQITDNALDFSLDANVSDTTREMVNSEDERGSIRSVGFMKGTLTYTAPDNDRTLPLFFWYPSTDPPGPGVRYNSLVPSDNATEDASIATQSTLPVLLFSHGTRGFGAATVPFLAEHFARQGWLVVAWDHSGDTTFNSSGTAQTFLHRPLDVSAVLDYLFAENATHPFTTLITQRVMLAGHSRGGYTCLAIGGGTIDAMYFDDECGSENSTDFCAAYTAHRSTFEDGFRDERVGAIVLLASGEYDRFNQGVGAVTIPTLIWTSGQDLNNPNEVDGDRIWMHLIGSNKFRFNLTNGGHFTYTSLCDYIAALGDNNGCDLDNYPLRDAHALVNEYTLLFADAYLLDDMAARQRFDATRAETFDDENIEFFKKGSP